MDVLRPPLLYIHGRCYRINNPESEYYETNQSGVEWDDNPSNYGTSECTLDEPCDGGDDDDEYDIQQTESGRYKTTFHIARVYYGMVIGKKGQTKKRLEDETKTIIRVPRLPSEKEIIITGSSKRAVVTARRRIEYMAMSSRKNQQFTHFLSIPLTSPSVKDQFLRFKSEVLQNCLSRGVDDTIFQNPDKLHLTICTLVLLDDIERSEATKVLEQCKLDVIDPLMEGNSITILLAGVEYMNDDPTEVDVLYAKVLANEILQTLVDQIVNYCSSKGIIDKQYDRFKLHATIMNTLFRESKTDDPTQSRNRETFNASPILEMFHDFEFGEITIEGIHLSTRYTSSKTDGYYQSSTQLSLYM